MKRFQLGAAILSLLFFQFLVSHGFAQDTERMPWFTADAVPRICELWFDGGSLCYKMEDDSSFGDDEEILLLNDSGESFYYRAYDGSSLYCDDWYTDFSVNPKARYYYGPDGCAVCGAVHVDGVFQLFDGHGKIRPNDTVLINGETWISDYSGVLSLVTTPTESPT
ncbi:MAG: hypothetical protein K6C08_11915, partial [Oscillospiraceae bacterium]|nr:hypothetical protein [Oscillospiraceae bacterium]